MTIGMRLKKLRWERDLTTTVAAKLLGIARPTLVSWENDVTIPNLEKALKIARFYSVSVDYLAGGTDEKQ